MTNDWINQNVLFVHSDVDDSGLPVHAIRILAHLKRRLGISGTKSPGTRSMARVCRMKRDTVIAQLAILERYHWIKINRRAGRVSGYELLGKAKLLYIDHRLDDLGLSPFQFRIVAHMARLASVDAVGSFFINVSDFARVCRMKRDTVRRTLEQLEAMDLYCAYSYATNPMYCLTLYDRFRREQLSANVKQTLSKAIAHNRETTPGQNGDHPWPNERPLGGEKGDHPLAKRETERYSSEDAPSKILHRKCSIEESPVPYGTDDSFALASGSLNQTEQTKPEPITNIVTMTAIEDPPVIETETPEERRARRRQVAYVTAETLRRLNAEWKPQGYMPSWHYLQLAEEMGTADVPERKLVERLMRARAEVKRLEAA